MSNFKGIYNPNYKHGETLKSHYCISGTPINYYTFMDGTKQCRKCYLQKATKKYYCMDCGKLVSKKGCKRCSSCNVKGNRNPMFGKPGYNSGRTISKISRHKMRLAKLGKYLGNNNPNWNNGSSFFPYSIEFNSLLKKQIRERDNYTCQNCGITEKKHKTLYNQTLHIHHIDYNKTNCNANNLITVCISCNSKANINRTTWINFYRHKLERE